MIGVSFATNVDPSELAALWNRAIEAQREGYQDCQVSAQQLTALLQDLGSSSAVSVATEDAQLVGFALGYAPDDRDAPCWLAGVGVDPGHWRKGIGRGLLQALERRFLEAGRTAIATQTFRMPVSLLRRPFLDTGPYQFLLSCGYHPVSHELYLRNDLVRFHVSDELKRRRDALAAEGVQFQKYDPADRTELLELLGRSFSAAWRHTVEQATDADRRPTIFVVRAAGRMVGFMGPVRITQPGMPGSFGSPGVDPEFRGRGIGKVLIHLSLDYLKEAGASEVRYSTSVDNPARHIYFDSGAELLGVYCSSFRKILPADRA